MKCNFALRGSFVAERIRGLYVGASSDAIEVLVLRTESYL